MKSADFIKKMTADELPPCILLLGDDLYFVDGSLKKIKALSNIANEELNISKYDEENYKAFLQSLDMFPFLSEKRLSVLSIDTINKKKPSEKKDEGENEPVQTETEELKNKAQQEMLKSLKRYAESPNPSTVAVVCIKSGVSGLDGYFTVDCGNEDIKNISRWIVLTLRRRGLTITEELAEIIATRCDLDMSSVKNCTELLACYKESGVIEREDVDDLVADQAEAQIFDLINAVVEKNINKAFSLIDKIKAQKMATTVFLSTLYGNYRRMFVSLLSELSNEELAAELKVKPYAILMSRRLAKKYSAKRLKESMEYLASVDAKIKTGKIRDDYTIENCVFHLANI